MPRIPLVLLVAALLIAAGASGAADTARTENPGRPRVLLATLDGPISVGAAEYIRSALDRAAAEGFDAFLLRLDTPGGRLDTTIEITRAFQESRVPVLVWVGPAGASASSAGLFVMLAADVAAMHPVSNIGASHPVADQGKDIEQVYGKDEALKALNDTVARVRALAALHHRNADWAEKAVRESVSFTAEQAVKENVVDFVAPDPAAVLQRADGRRIGPDEHPRILHLTGASLVPVEPTLRQRFLEFLSDGSVVAILTMLGLLGIGIEFYHPGALLPGLAGAICLFLVFVASQLIPVNLAAVLLLVAGAGLLVSEGYFTSHGVAAVGGAVCLVIGMLFLVNTGGPGGNFEAGAFSVSPWIVWPTPLALAAVFGFMGWKVARGRRAPLQLGAPALVGADAETLSEIGPEGGQVFLHGEYWQARSAAPIPRGARVRVRTVEGLVVIVEEDGALR
jgi:membrane-bound serine protease (ClpP class)